MCGIAGFCSFEKYFLPDGEPWKRILIEMRKSIAHRGPDSAGEYLCEHAGLSHARLSIRDPALGSQPMVRTVDGADYVIVYNGEIYNVDEIKPNLVRAGCRFETTTDTEVILYSYITYGDDFVKMLNGIFAFAIWDGARKQLILYRDRLGVKPLFYTVKSNTLIFGSEIKALFCHPQVSPGIDMNSFREIFGTGPARTPGNGVFRDIYEVMPGHYILYSNGNFIDKQYWKLEAREHTDNYEQTLETVSFMVRDAIVRQMVADVPVCTFLSGGIDSSIVTAVAANYLRSGSPGNGPGYSSRHNSNNGSCNNQGNGSRNGPYNRSGNSTRNNLRGNSGKGSNSGPGNCSDGSPGNSSGLGTFSFDFRDNHAYFRENAFQPARDRPYVDVMLGEYPLDHTYLECNEEDLANLLYTAVNSRDLPGMADVDASLFYFCSLVSKQYKVALTGECADEIFGGYPWFYRDELMNADGFPWSSDISARTAVLSSDFVEELRLHEYVNDKYLDSVRSAPSLSGEIPSDAKHRKITYLNIKWFMQTLLDRMDRMSMYCGLEARVPYADHRIVEYVYNVPWDMKYRNGVAKSLLRESCRDLLPEKILLRKKSPFPKTYHPNYEKLVCQAVREIVSNPNSPINPLIDRKKLLTFTKSPSGAGKPWFGQLMAAPQLLAYLIQVNYWLEKYL